MNYYSHACVHHFALGFKIEQDICDMKAEENSEQQQQIILKELEEKIKNLNQKEVGGHY